MDRERIYRELRYYTKIGEALVDLNLHYRSGFNNIFTQKGMVAASVDVIPDCNLRCRHCYLFGKGHQKETINDKEFLNNLDEFVCKYPTILHCNWVGGEPLLRPDRLRKGMEYFFANWVITNGTQPIEGDWPKNSFFFISIDGLKDTHNKIRTPFGWKPAPGETVYDLAMEHALKATAPVGIHTVINKMNVLEIPSLVEQWSQAVKSNHSRHVKGFAFSFHTPKLADRLSGMSSIDEKLWLNDEQRREAVKMLLELKKQHGDFIILSPAQITRFNPKHQLEFYGQNCIVPVKGFSVDTKFEKKTPCVMGEGMDCNKCGCVVPAISRKAELPLLILRLCF